MLEVLSLVGTTSKDTDFSICLIRNKKNAESGIKFPPKLRLIYGLTCCPLS